MRRRRGARYRKRKPMPAIVIACLLGIAAIVVWITVINKAGDINAEVACPPPSASSVVEQPLAHDSLDNVTPAPPSEIQLHVLNASNQRGAASQVATALDDMGFTQVAAPADDTLYPNHDMHCQGQIRFGANGTAAARTLSLVVPCTQLVRDNRQDASVDLAIGTNFSQLQPSSSAVQALQQLNAWAAQHPAPAGGEQAQDVLKPQLSPALLSAAHNITC